MNRSIMKYIIFIAFSILLNLNNLSTNAEDALKSELIPNKFAAFDELKKWAETSTFGGGNLIKLRGNFGIYYIADRLHTSGMPTSESIFYKQEESFYKMIYYLPFKYVTRKYEFENGKIVVTEKALGGKEIKIVIAENEL
jgi:hypothetical protein